MVIECLSNNINPEKAAIVDIALQTYGNIKLTLCLKALEISLKTLRSISDSLFFTFITNILTCVCMCGQEASYFAIRCKKE